MSSSATIKINFRGGIISPGDLYNIMVAATRAGIRHVSFGLRQQLLITVDTLNHHLLVSELELLGVSYETDNELYPNIVSSYPAEEIFITNTWLSEGTYKDLFDGIDYQPQLKINVSDSNQSFTPMLTGNINWVASKEALHFWHLLIRFPKTNTIFEWGQMVYTNDVARISKEIEELILQNRTAFFDNPLAEGNALMKLVHTNRYITRPADKRVQLPHFNLPYYEGLNRYNNKYWLGVYKRDELFNVDFLKEVCRLCLDTKIGLLCSTPWKTIIIKGIEEKDRPLWSRLLDKYQLNMRHAANELNFQVEDNCREGLQIKHYLVKKLNDEDTRTFGVCIGIKTRSKSEVFSSILVRRKPLIRLFGWEFLHVYDILCAHEYNPNERTDFVFSTNNPRFVLAEQLRRSLVRFYHSQANKNAVADKKIAVLKSVLKETAKKADTDYVHQCSHCLSVYDEMVGEPDKGIDRGIKFELLPDDYTCPLCEAGKEAFVKTEKSKLGSEAV